MRTEVAAQAGWAARARSKAVADVLGGGLGQVGQLLPGEGGVVGGTAGADDTPGELGDHLGRDHVGGGARTGRGGGDGVGPEGFRLRHEAEGTRRRTPLGTHG